MQQLLLKPSWYCIMYACHYLWAQNVCRGWPVYVRAEIREGGLPLLPALKNLSLMTWRACDVNLVIILASKWQVLKVGVSIFSAVLWIEIEDLNTILFNVICQNKWLLLKVVGMQALKSWKRKFIKIIMQKTLHPIVNVLACVSTQTCPSRTFATADNISIQVNICGALNTT
jgi:hypothetical protein